jgi:murein DD-endopeptidase MepM/ murein hydrolase activator NlpD
MKIFPNIFICCAVLFIYFYAQVSRALDADDTTAIGPVVINGVWQQGELLSGKAPPGARVELLGQVPVMLADGRFLFGLDRDAPNQVLIRVSLNGQKWQLQQPIAPRQYNLQRVNGVEDKYVNPDASLNARIAREAKLIEQARARRDSTDAAFKPFAWPAKGPISGVFGSQRVFNGVPKRPHYGIDIAGPIGTKVLAPQDALVTLAEDDLFYSGGTVILDHGLGLSSTCMHLSRVLVKRGQRVKQGDVIALIGNTGRVTGPHLDWRMNWHNQHIDPEPLVRGKPMPNIQ